MSSIRLLTIGFSSALILSALITHGQDIPKVIPPAPDAAAIQRFGDIPISPYSGTPNISIPLYTIKSGDISVPISISYNASGIRVSDEASRVGLGWVLNAGGVISRNIIGKDDFESYHGAGFDIDLGPRTDQGASFNYMFNCLITVNGDSLPQVPLNSLTVDFQPDLYSFNFNGHSGKFALKRDKTPILSRIEKIDIKLTDTVNANSWEIKTSDGFRYKFENIESYVDISGLHKSSWYLSKISSPTGRSIDFQYDTLVSNIQQAGTYFESNPVGYALMICDVPPSMPSPYSNSVTGKTYHSLYLSKIVSDQCEVKFIYSTGRIDITNDVKLDSVKIYSKNYGDAHEKLLKSWDFAYTYFTGTSKYGSADTLAVNSKRLKLLSVKESSATDSLPPYNFTYNDPGSGPSKLSFGRDHWGYYNGKNGNASLIPSFYGTLLGMTVAPGSMGTERNTDPNYSQLFILNKIQYPTGGYSVFEYESNDFDLSYSMSNDHTFWSSYLPAIPTNLQKGFSGISAGGTFTDTLDLTNMWPYAQWTTVTAYFIKTSGLDVSTVNQITYSLKDTAGVEVGGGYVGSFLGQTSPPMTEWLGTQSSNSGVKMTLIKGLTAQKYTWSFTVPAGLTAANVVVAYTKGEGFDPIISSGDTVHNAAFGGGLRIRRIKDSAGTSNPIAARRYYYHYRSNGKTYSYGRRMARPNYSYYDFVLGGSYGGSACSAPCLMRESDSNIPLNGSANGIAVGYDKVEEYFGENGDNGKVFYEYRNRPDIILDYKVTIGAPGPLGTIPLKPPYGGVISDAGNGNLLKKTTYGKYNGQFVIVKIDSNAYEELSNYNHGILYGIDRRVVGSSNVPGLDCGMLSFSIYPALTINRGMLTSSYSKVYDATGTIGPFITGHEYVYDTTSHLQLSSESTYKSNGDKLTTSYKYAADYVDANCDSAVFRMKGTQYIHSMPITSQTFFTRGTDKFLTSGSISKFEWANSKINLKEVAALETKQPININTPPTAYNPSSGSYPSGYSARILFDSYDSLGNLLQVHKISDINISYIWDYYLNYPAAEISNADITNCAATSFESNSKGNWAFSGSVANDTSAPTGTRCYSLSGGSVSKSSLNSSGNYVVTYWSKNGQQTVSNSGTAISGRSLGSWTYYEHPVFNPSGGTVTVSGSGTIDELRLYPKGALMATFTYKPLVGTTSKCDANNRISYYEYDAFGRLAIVRDQDRNIVKKLCYNYAGQTENCNDGYFGNVLKTGTYVRNNCDSFLIGDSVLYVVPTNTYISLIGQSYVDSLAQADVNANGQTYANNNGGCNCDTFGCVAPSRKCIEDRCLEGVIYCVSTVYDKPSNSYLNTYHYFFSDCTSAFSHTTTTSTPDHPSTPCP